MAKPASEVLRAFPEQPGSTTWICQNCTKRTEYRVDTEGMTCNCKGWEYRRKCRHLDYALFRAKLYGGDREVFEALVEKLLKTR